MVYIAIECLKKSCGFSDILQKEGRDLNKIILFLLIDKCDKFLGGGY